MLLYYLLKAILVSLNKGLYLLNKCIVAYIIEVRKDIKALDLIIRSVLRLLVKVI